MRPLSNTPFSYIINLAKRHSACFLFSSYLFKSVSYFPDLSASEGNRNHANNMKDGYKHDTYTTKISGRLDPPQRFDASRPLTISKLGDLKSIFLSCALPTTDGLNLPLLPSVLYSALSLLSCASVPILKRLNCPTTRIWSSRPERSSLTPHNVS